MRRLLELLIVTLTFQSFADSPGNLDDLEQRVRSMELEIKKLQARGVTEGLSRSGAIRSIVTDVLNEADTRCHFMTDQTSAGWDNGFFLSNMDDTFRLEIDGRIQIRFASNFQRGSDLIDHQRSGFDNRRLQIKFSGHVFDPRWTYEVELEVDNSGGTAGLNTATIGYDLNDKWSLTFGKFKPPFMREAHTSSKRLLAVERSLVHQSLKQGRSEGAQLSFANDRLRWHVEIHDDFGGSGSTPALMRGAEFEMSSRAEWLAFGTFKQFQDFTSWRGEEPGLLLAIALHYRKDEYGTAVDTDERELFAWTIDVGYENNGFNVFAAIVGHHSMFDALPDRDVFGVVLQGGYLIRDDVEIFVRYEWGDDDIGDSELSILTAGTTWFISGDHTLKLVSDVGYAFDAVSDYWSSSGAAWRTDAPDEDGQLVLRTQLQLLF